MRLWCIMKKLSAILNSVTQRTGIEVTAFSDNMKYVITGSNTPPVMPNRTDFSQIYASQKQNKTFFRFRYSGVNFIGSIDGAGKTTENYAYLITSIIENFKDETNGLNPSEVLKRILLDEISSEGIQAFLKENGIIDGLCFCLAISSDKRMCEAVKNYLSTKQQNKNLVTVIDDTTLAYIQMVEPEAEKPSVKDFAQSLHTEILRATGAKVVIGCGTYKESVNKVFLSYKEGLAAMKMNGFLCNNSFVRTFTDFLMIRLIEDVPRYKLKELTSNLLTEEAKALFDDTEMSKTAEVFFENNLNLSEASRELYTHRNTLSYRLDKIKRVANLDIRRFSDALTFRLLSVIKKISD